MAFVVPDAWARCVDEVDSGYEGGHIYTPIQNYLFVPEDQWPEAVKNYLFPQLLPGAGGQQYTIKTREPALRANNDDLLAALIASADYDRHVFSNNPEPGTVLANAPLVIAGINKFKIFGWITMSNFLNNIISRPNSATHRNPGRHGTWSLLYCPLMWQAVKKYRDGELAEGIAPHADVPDVPAAWLTYGLEPTVAAAPLYKMPDNERFFLEAARDLARNTEFMQFMIAALRNPPAGMAVPPRVAPREVNTRREVRSVPRVNAPRITGQRAVITAAQMSAFANIDRDLRALGLLSGGKRRVRYTTRRRRLAKKKSTRGKRRS